MADEGAAATEPQGGGARAGTWAMSEPGSYSDPGGNKMAPRPAPAPVATKTKPHMSMIVVVFTPFCDMASDE